MERLSIHIVSEVQSFLDFKSYCKCSGVSNTWRKLFIGPFKFEVKLTELLILPYDIPLIKQVCNRIQRLTIDVSGGFGNIIWILGSLTQVKHLRCDTLNYNHIQQDMLYKVCLMSRKSITTVRCRFSGTLFLKMAGMEFPNVREFWTIAGGDIGHEEMRLFENELHLRFPNLKRLGVCPMYFEIVKRPMISIVQFRNSWRRFFVKKLNNVSDDDFPHAFDDCVRQNLESYKHLEYKKLPELEIFVVHPN